MLEESDDEPLIKKFKINKLKNMAREASVKIYKIDKRLVSFLMKNKQQVNLDDHNIKNYKGIYDECSKPKDPSMSINDKMHPSIKIEDFEENPGITQIVSQVLQKNKMAENVVRTPAAPHELDSPRRSTRAAKSRFQVMYNDSIYQKSQSQRSQYEELFSTPPAPSRKRNTKKFCCKCNTKSVLPEKLIIFRNNTDGNCKELLIEVVIPSDLLKKNAIRKYNNLLLDLNHLPSDYYPTVSKTEIANVEYVDPSTNNSVSFPISNTNTHSKTTKMLIKKMPKKDNRIRKVKNIVKVRPKLPKLEVLSSPSTQSKRNLDALAPGEQASLSDMPVNTTNNVRSPQLVTSTTNNNETAVKPTNLLDEIGYRQPDGQFSSMNDDSTVQLVPLNRLFAENEDICVPNGSFKHMPDISSIESDFNFDLMDPSITKEDSEPYMIPKMSVEENKNEEIHENYFDKNISKAELSYKDCNISQIDGEILKMRSVLEDDTLSLCASDDGLDMFNEIEEKTPADKNNNDNADNTNKFRSPIIFNNNETDKTFKRIVVNDDVNQSDKILSLKKTANTIAPVATIDNSYFHGSSSKLNFPNFKIQKNVSNSNVNVESRSILDDYIEETTIDTRRKPNDTSISNSFIHVFNHPCIAFLRNNYCNKNCGFSHDLPDPTKVGNALRNLNNKSLNDCFQQTCVYPDIIFKYFGEFIKIYVSTKDTQSILQCFSKIVETQKNREYYVAPVKKALIDCNWRQIHTPYRMFLSIRCFENITEVLNLLILELLIEINIEPLTEYILDILKHTSYLVPIHILAKVVEKCNAIPFGKLSTELLVIIKSRFVEIHDIKNEDMKKTFQIFLKNVPQAQ